MADVSPMPLAGGHHPDDRDMPRLPLARRADFDLGSISVRPSRLLLQGAAAAVPLERRMMEVLLALADAEGGVLDREQLLQSCWPGVVVGEDALHRAISGLRKAAAAAGDGFAIETVPRIGYRLQVKPGAETEAAPAATGADVVESSPASPSRRALLSGAVALASVSAGLFWVMRRPGANPEAVRLMEEARIAQQEGMPDAYVQAIRQLEHVVEIAPDDASGWGQLALTRALADEHSSPETRAAVIPQIGKAARRALQLEPANADARAALAIALPYYGDWLAAEQRLDAVLRDHPAHIESQDSRAFLLTATGRVREGSEARLAFAEQAASNANMQFRLTYCLWFLNRVDEADRVAARALQMWPGHPGIWFSRLWLLAGTGRHDRALAHIADEVARPPLPKPMVETLRAATAAAATRDRQQTVAAAAMVMKGAERSVAGVVNAMMLLNLMGESDRAFDLATAYYLERGPLIAAMQWRPGQPMVQDQRRRKTNMLFTPIAETMQRDPRFLPLMQGMGLTDYWARRGIQPDFLKTGPDVSGQPSR